MLADDAELAAGTATAVIAAAIAPADRNSVTLMRLDGRVILHTRVLFAAVKRLQQTCTPIASRDCLVLR